MAVVTSRVCDLGEGKEHEGEVEEVLVGAGDEFFKLDACPKDREAIDKALERFVAAGTPISLKDAARAANGSSFDPAVVRAWCQRNGKQLGDRGRIPAEFVAEWRKATQAS